MVFYFNMSKMNPLAGLIANYGDSEDESEDDTRVGSGGIENNINHIGNVPAGHGYGNVAAAIHPAPIPHCREYYFLFVVVYVDRLIS